MTVRFAAKFLLGAALMMPVHFANAQTLPTSVVAQFMANPGQALSQNPAGGPGLTKQVRDLLTSDKTTLASIMGLLKDASPDQQTAIADGLAQAAKQQAQNDPAFANDIQAAVAASGLPAVIKQYASIAGDTGTASTGGGGTGGGGPNNQGAPGGGQNNGAFNNPNTFASNTGNPFSNSTLGGSSFSESFTTNNNTTINNSVSPQ